MIHVHIYFLYTPRFTYEYNIFDKYMTAKKIRPGTSRGGDTYRSRVARSGRPGEFRGLKMVQIIKNRYESYIFNHDMMKVGRKIGI